MCTALKIATIFRMAVKKKRGRPPIDNPATEKLSNVRVTPEQLEVFKAAAATHDEPLAAWVKRNLLSIAKKDLKSS